MGSHRASEGYQLFDAAGRRLEVKQQQTRRGTNSTSNEPDAPSSGIVEPIASRRTWTVLQLPPSHPNDFAKLSAFISTLRARLTSRPLLEAAGRSCADNIEALIECHDALHEVLECVIDLGSYCDPPAGAAIDLDEILDWCIAVKVDLDRSFVANLPLAVVAPKQVRGGKRASIN